MSEKPKVASLLVELGVEDLPAKAVVSLATDIAQSVEEGLVNDGFKSERNVEPMATLRRLSFRIKDLPTSLPEQEVERKGPSLKVAFNDDDNPSPAGLGFAKSCGVDFKALEQKDQRLYWQGKVAGASLSDRLQHHITHALANAALNKRMRWGHHHYEFIRPLRWILALHDQQVLEIEVMGIKAGGVSYGHRAYCQKPITIKSAEDGVYENALEKGKVMVSHDQRKEQIRKMFEETFPTSQSTQPQFLSEIENFYGGDLQDGAHDDIIDALVYEKAAMTEWPHPVVGEVDKELLQQLPHSIVIQALMKNQHFFLSLDDDGKLSHRFLAIADIESKGNDNIRHGFERVAHPRLADAAFLLHSDLKIGLQGRQSELQQVTFHRALGSLHDKSQRIAQLSRSIAAQIHAVNKEFAIDNDALQKAATMCKLDLLTDTVREYPTLQGEIGRHCIAKEDKGKGLVADIVAEHYMPRCAGGDLPTHNESYILALADRMDTLTGIFGSGNQPSGSKDPYALRRASIAVIRLVLELGERFAQSCGARLNLNLFDLIDEAAQCYQQQMDPFPEDTITAAKHYLLERMKHYYLAESADTHFSPDQVEATMAIRPEYVLDFDARINAIHSLASTPEIEALIAANKRIKNILQKNKKSTANSTTDIVESALEDEAEKLLYRELQTCHQTSSRLIEQQQYTEALQHLSALHTPVSRFFDEVMVMVEDETKRNNRINLLREVRALFMGIGDFSKLNTE